MSTDQFPSASQTDDLLAQSAEMANFYNAPVAMAQLVLANSSSLADRAAKVAQAESAEAEPSCQQNLYVSFFFDGTGNNMDADTPTKEHSNVARLFMAHRENDSKAGIYKIYIPGIGTYFKDIGDKGGSTTELAFGADGEDRLEWAMTQFESLLAQHVAIAQNATNKIGIIKISVFGFSRGATAARAFVRNFQEKCQRSGADWRWIKGGYPVRCTFLGIWDTVASVGFPMSANNTSYMQSLGFRDLPTALKNRAKSLDTLAFGMPGADPAPGSHDGHSVWAHSLGIVDIVERCVHMVGAHEIRNSFPVDSCIRSGRYPESVEEMVYPGVHSDVGGGYRPGEGARSLEPSQMLSLLPLRAMHKKASGYGVPLLPLESLTQPIQQESFALDPASAPKFNEMVNLWRYYMQHAGLGGKPIGDMFNSHSRLYFGWRFYKIRENNIARNQKKPTQDDAELQKEEAEWQLERRDLAAEMKPAESDMNAANHALRLAQNDLRQAQLGNGQHAFDSESQDDLQAKVDAAQRSSHAATDNYRRLQARYDTLPSTDGTLTKNLEIYDEQLLADAVKILKHHQTFPDLPVRPHYKALLDAYVAEFLDNAGLRDEKIIAFFDNYIHDSLAGFARDATLPSDPRVIYIGANVKADYALNNMFQPMQTREPALDVG